MKKVKLIFFEPGQKAGAEGRARRRDVRSRVTDERRTMRRVRVQQARRAVRMSQGLGVCVDVIDSSNIVFKKV